VEAVKESSNGFIVLDYLKADFVFGTRRILARSALLRDGLRRKERFSFVLNGTSELVP
jgi:hypothetical protein